MYNKKSKIYSVLVISFLFFIIVIQEVSSIGYIIKVPSAQNCYGVELDEYGSQSSSAVWALYWDDGKYIWAKAIFPRGGNLIECGINAIKPPKYFYFEGSGHSGVYFYRNQIKKIVIKFEVMVDHSMGEFKHTRGLKYNVLTHQHPNGLFQQDFILDYFPNDELIYKTKIQIDYSHYSSFINDVRSGSDWITGLRLTIESTKEFGNVYINIDYIKIYYYN